MEITQFIDRIHVASEQLPNLLLKSYLDIAKDAKAIIENRVQETGINAKGSSFASIRQYSDAYLKAKQHLTVSGKGKVRKGKTSDKKGNVIQGRYRGFVDFTASGAMWNNINVIAEQAVIDQSGIRVIVDARSQENKDKLDGNVSGNGKWSGRGQILELSDDELDRLRESLEINFKEHFESFFE